MGAHPSTTQYAEGPIFLSSDGVGAAERRNDLKNGPLLMYRGNKAKGAARKWGAATLAGWGVS